MIAARRAEEIPLQRGEHGAPGRGSIRAAEEDAVRVDAKGDAESEGCSWGTDS